MRPPGRSAHPAEPETGATDRRRFRRLYLDNPRCAGEVVRQAVDRDGDRADATVGTLDRVLAADPSLARRRAALRALRGAYGSDALIALLHRHAHRRVEAGPCVKTHDARGNLIGIDHPHMRAFLDVRRAPVQRTAGHLPTGTTVRVMPRPRGQRFGRPRRRTGSSSRTSSADPGPGGDGPGEPAALARRVS